MAYLLYSLLFCERSSSGRAPPCQGGGSEFEPRRSLQKKERQPKGCLSFFSEERVVCSNSVPPPLKTRKARFFNPRSPGVPAKGRRPFVRWAEASPGLVAPSLSSQHQGRTPPLPELGTSTSKNAQSAFFSIRGRLGSPQRAAGTLWGGRKRVRASSPFLCLNERQGRTPPFPRTRYLHLKRALRVFLIRGRPGSLQRACGPLWGGRKRVRASSPLLCPDKQQR